MPYTNASGPSVGERVLFNRRKIDHVRLWGGGRGPQQVRGTIKSYTAEIGSGNISKESSKIVQRKKCKDSAKLVQS